MDPPEHASLLQTFSIKNSRQLALQQGEPYMLHPGEYIKFGALECRVDMSVSRVPPALSSWHAAIQAS